MLYHGWILWPLSSSFMVLVLAMIRTLTAVSLFFVSLFFGHAARFPDQGSNLCPLHWKCGILTTGPPGNSLYPSYISSTLGKWFMHWTFICFSMSVSLLSLSACLFAAVISFTKINLAYAVTSHQSIFPLVVPED